jgi:outer membrane protein
MKKLLVTIAALAMAVPAFAQSAAPARFAVVDLQKVLNLSNAGKAEQEKLKKLNDDKANKAQKMQEELAALNNDITTKKLSLSEEKLANMQKQLTEKQVALQRYGQDAERELNDAFEHAQTELLGKVRPVIDALAKDLGLAAVFVKSEAGLIYASDAIDITDSVVKKFNEATTTSAPAAAAAKKP